MNEQIDVEEAAEMAHCALINLDNMKKIMPALALNPLFALTRHQLESAVRCLGREAFGVGE